MNPDTYGVSVERLQEITGCTLDTARRWKRTGHVPAYAARLMRIFFRGDLGELNSDWAGWVLNCNGLHPPNGDRPFGPGHVSTIQWHMHQVGHLTRELADARKRIAVCEHCAHCNRADAQRRPFWRSKR